MKQGGVEFLAQDGEKANKLVARKKNCRDATGSIILRKQTWSS